MSLRSLTCCATGAALLLALAAPVAAQQASAPATDSATVALPPRPRPLLYDSLPLPTLPPAASTPLPAVERALQPLAEFVLRGRDFEKKLQAHQQLRDYLAQVLQRPDSYDYRFDSLTTVSRVYPADQSLRIFTWQLVDPSGNHTYGGLVQRRFVPPPPAGTKRRKSDPLPPPQYVVIPLQDRIDRSRDIEQIQLEPDTWLGALYYQPRNSEFGVLSYDGAFQRLNGVTGKMRMEQTRYYVVLGYNGHDIGSNYKIVDVLVPDPRVATKVVFGAPIFYFGPMPKTRVVFKYADNSPFNLNLAQVVEGKRKRTPMIVFDHVAPPARNPLTTPQWDLGADGSQDALRWFDRTFELRKGFFGIRRNVTVYDEQLEKYDPKEQRARIEAEQKRLRDAGIRMERASASRRNR